METHIPAMCMVFLFISSAAVALQHEPKTNDEPLESLAFLVGGTWSAEGEIKGFGSYTAERKYEWVLNSQFVEQRHVMTISDTRIETMGIIGWNPETKQILAWGFGSDGGIAASTALVGEQGENRFEGSRVGPYNAGRIRATLRKVNDDELLEIAEIKQGTEWVEMFTFRFVRIR